jgi:hypothetical protein
MDAACGQIALPKSLLESRFQRASKSLKTGNFRPVWAFDVLTLQTAE